MNKSKKFLLGLILSIGIFVSIGFFLPSEIKLEREQTVDAPIAMIYDQVINLHLWENWSPWHKLDPHMTINYSNIGIGEGASYSWTSKKKNVGNGTLTITKAEAFKSIETAMDFGEQGTATANFTFEEQNGKVLVKWDMNSSIGNNPMARWMGILMKAMIKKSYDQGLMAIDEQCQQLKENTWYHVNVKQYEPIKTYAIGANNISQEKKAVFMHEAFTKLTKELNNNNIDITGFPFAIYYTWDENVDLACAFSVDDNSQIIKGLEQQIIEKQYYAEISYTGAYESLTKAHKFLFDWVEQNNLIISGPIIEKYLNDPEVETDPNKFVTHILYPIE